MSRIRLVLVGIAFPGLALTPAGSSAQTPLTQAFSFQGRLNVSGSPATGSYDMTFSLWSADVGGSLLGCQCMDNVAVSAGLFAVTLNDAGQFGATAFNGDERWLEVRVKADSTAGNCLVGPGCAVGGVGFTTLTPRQKLTATPYASFALAAPWAGISGVPADLADGDDGGDGHSLDAADGSPADAVFVDNAGKVGVGTATPLALTHLRATDQLLPAAALVSDDLVVEDADAVLGLYSSGQGGSAGSTISFGEVSAGALVSKWSVFREQDTSGGELLFTFGTSPTPTFNTDILVLEPSGEIGVGVSNPQARLHIGGTAGADGIMFPDGSLQTTAASGGTGFWTSNGSNIYNNNTGDVGVGTSSPVLNLEVRKSGSANLGAVATLLSNPIGWTYIGAGQDNSIAWKSGSSLLLGTTTAIDGTLNDLVRITSDGAVETRGYSLNLGIAVYATLDRFDLASATLKLYNQTGGVHTAAELSSVGDQGVLRLFDGTTETVALDGSGGGGGGGLSLRNNSGVATVSVDGDSSDAGAITVLASNGTPTVQILGAEVAGQGGQIQLFKADGTATIILDAEHSGDGRIITQELEITGGSDLSEQFDVANADEPIEPGMLVSIDAARPGKLQVCRSAYDRAVAGVISGAGGVKPGMMMGQRDTLADGAHPVALTGRVYCWCDASNGAIQPGDLLTTSDVAGHAMKATDYPRAHGAIIGKAMTSLVDGRGLVLVLVSLQ